MEKTPHEPLEINLEEWEFLSDNTSFLDFGPEEVKDLLSKEIIYMDYFREEPKLIQYQEFDEQKNPAELTASKNHDPDEAEGFKDISISHLLFKLNPDGEQLIELPPAVMPELSQGKSEPEEKISMHEEEKEKPIWEGSSISICGRRLPGAVGALCSIGVAAAATIFIVVLGGRQQKQQPKHHHYDHNHHRHQQNQIVQFKLLADDKSLTQVVRQASRLNQMLAAARGSPEMMRRANISFGGYYDRI